MNEALESLYQGKKLSTQEAKELLITLAKEQIPDVQIAAVLSVLRVRGVTVSEMLGFRHAMQDLAHSVKFNEPVIDVCGTGGDGKNTFNISTVSAFVLAGCGVKVAKHGNYGVSSVCGSSNVLEALGIYFSSDQGELQAMLDGAGICIMHAPLFHPAMKRFAGIRKELGVKTVFNLLGPLVNPCNPQAQYSGVFQHEYLRMYGEVLERAGIKYSVVYSLDGYDEISLTGPFKLISNEREQQLEPQDLDMPVYSQKDLAGGSSIEEAASLFLDVLKGAGTDAQNDVVCANAAFAYRTVTPKPIADCIRNVRESLHSGAAMNSLEQLQKISKELK